MYILGLYVVFLLLSLFSPSFSLLFFPAIKTFTQSSRSKRGNVLFSYSCQVTLRLGTGMNFRLLASNDLTLYWQWLEEVRSWKAMFVGRLKYVAAGIVASRMAALWRAVKSGLAVKPNVSLTLVVTLSKIDFSRCFCDFSACEHANANGCDACFLRRHSSR